MTITLYGFARTRASRCLWMLEEIGAPYAHVPTPTAPEETGSAAFRAINPDGRIPTLTDGDLTLWESNAINLHLARAHGGALGPRTAGEEARMTMWAVWAAATLEPDAHRLYVNTVAGPEAARDAAAARGAAARLARPLDALVLSLGPEGWLEGGRFTVADLTVANVLLYLAGAPELIAARPPLADWFARATDRPAFRRMREMRERA